MGFGRAGSAAGLGERPGPWLRGPSRARLPPRSRRPAPALRAWLSAGAAAQAKLPGAQAGSGSGRRSPENLLIRRGQRGSGQSASEGAGPARPIGLRSGGLAPGRAGASGRAGQGGAPGGQRRGGARGRNFPPRPNPGRCCLGSLGSLFFLGSWVTFSCSRPSSALPSSPLPLWSLFPTPPCFLYPFPVSPFHRFAYLFLLSVAMSASLCPPPLSASLLSYHDHWS